MFSSCVWYLIWKSCKGCGAPQSQGTQMFTGHPDVHISRYWTCEHHSALFASWAWKYLTEMAVRQNLKPIFHPGSLLCLFLVGKTKPLVLTHSQMVDTHDPLKWTSPQQAMFFHSTSSRGRRERPRMPWLISWWNRCWLVKNIIPPPPEWFYIYRLVLFVRYPSLFKAHQQSWSFRYMYTIPWESKTIKNGP